MSLTAQEQDLFDVAQRALPSWYAPPDAVNEQLCAKAKIMGQAEALDRDWLTKQAFILTAEGPTSTTPDWLAQHALDRGTSRQNGESDAALAARLRTFDEDITPGGLLAAAQAAFVAAGGVGTAALLELPKDEAYAQINAPQTGTGGTFAKTGSIVTFTPTVAWAGGKPPYQNNGTHNPDMTYKIVVSGAASSGNNGTYTITGISGNGAVYTNASGVAGADATVAWRIDRYWYDGSFLTESSGHADAYLDRGYRIGSLSPTTIIILPYGTTEAMRLSVAEGLRARKPAGIVLAVERRSIP